MLPAMWTQLPCMNMDVSASAGQGGPFASRNAWSWRGQVSCMSHGTQPASYTRRSRLGSS